MYRIHPSFLLWTLEKLAEGEVVNQISVPEETAKWSKIALERMLEISADPKAKKA
jgi:quinolinate synthase